jgi:hypothetical protein
VAREGATYGMTKSMPLVVPALAEYMGLWRDCNGRVLKSYSAAGLRLEDGVDGVWDKDRLDGVMLAKLAVVRRDKRGRRAGRSSWVSVVPRVEVERWN